MNSPEKKPEEEIDFNAKTIVGDDIDSGAQTNIDPLNAETIVDHQKATREDIGSSASLDYSSASLDHGTTPESLRKKTLIQRFRDGLTKILKKKK